MEKTYTICMIIGFGIPCLLFLVGNVFHVLQDLGDLLDGIFDGILDDLDCGIDIGDTNISFLPLSIHSLCAGLLIFGTIGKTMFRGDNLILTNVIGIGCGYLAAVILQTLIRRLKKVEHGTYSTEHMTMFDAKVVNTIVPGGFGSISITTPDGNTRTYPAKCTDSTVRIPTATKVVIDHFEHNIAFVREELPFFRYEENQQEGGAQEKKGEAE